MRHPMRVPVSLANAFDATFEELIAEFAIREKLLPDVQSLHSNRYISRSVVPHIRKLSSLFNRVDKEQSASLDPYWKESSNPAHLRLAYFLYFMPSNLFRIASVWTELSRLGFKWSASDTLRGIEFGAGPAPGGCAAAAAEKHAPMGLPVAGNWALIEQDRAMLELGSRWAQTYFAQQGRTDWGVRPFHRKLDLKDGFLPRSAPRFNAWIMSFFLNELSESPERIAAALIDSWERHLEEEGVVILVEPALKLQSRKLLELRKALLAQIESRKLDWLQILLPCLGHQACGALAEAEDWCHEEVTWWRPPYFRLIDQLAELDRKTLPFSYLVLVRSRRAREEILPGLAGRTRARLVSPAHAEGKEQEFFICQQEGKRRARYRPRADEEKLERGDILIDAEIRGDVHASRIDRFGRLT